MTENENKNINPENQPENLPQTESFPPPENQPEILSPEQIENIKKSDNKQIENIKKEIDLTGQKDKIYQPEVLPPETKPDATKKTESNIPEPPAIDVEKTEQDIGDKESQPEKTDEKLLDQAVDQLESANPEPSRNQETPEQRRERLNAKAEIILKHPKIRSRLWYYQPELDRCYTQDEIAEIKDILLEKLGKEKFDELRHSPEESLKDFLEFLAEEIIKHPEKFDKIVEHLNLDEYKKLTRGGVIKKKAGGPDKEKELIEKINLAREKRKETELSKIETQQVPGGLPENANRTGKEKELEPGKSGGQPPEKPPESENGNNEGDNEKEPDKKTGLTKRSGSGLASGSADFGGVLAAIAGADSEKNKKTDNKDMRFWHDKAPIWGYFIAKYPLKLLWKFLGSAFAIAWLPFNGLKWKQWGMFARDKKDDKK